MNSTGIMFCLIIVIVVLLITYPNLSKYFDKLESHFKEKELEEKISKENEKNE